MFCNPRVETENVARGSWRQPAARWAGILAVLLATGVTPACKDDTLDEQVDDVTEDVKDTAEDAADKAEDVADKTEDAADKAEDELDKEK